MIAGGLLAVSSLSGLSPALPPPLPPLPEQEPELKPASSTMSLETEEHDFGTILNIDEQEFAFRFTNTGRDPLIIGEIKSTCGCTVPDIEKKVYQPGESGEIIVRYNPHGKRGHDSRSVTVKTNAIAQPTVKLTIKANVLQLVELEPTMLQFGQVDKGKSKQMELWVGGRTEDFKVTHATTNMPDVYTVQVGETELHAFGLEKEQLRATKLVVSLRPDAPVGMHSAELTIRTTDERAPVQRTQVLSQVLGDLAVVPPRISLGRVEPGQTFSREFQVKSRSGEPFKINQIEQRDSTADVQFEFAPEDPKNPTVWRVKMTGAARANERRILGLILLRTDVKGEESVEVRYNGFVNVQNPQN
ncbi:MAG: DUF1573 domain-containing protein [Phycisphaerales bacterium]